MILILLIKFLFESIMMTALPDNPMTFIQKVVSDPKAKFRVTSQELSLLLRHLDLITNMHDKGLFIVVISELINYQFSTFYIKLKSVHG